MKTEDRHIIDKMIVPDMADQLFYIRKKKGLTRGQLAKMSGISRSFLYKFEHKECGISLETFLRLAHTLDYLPILIPKDLYEMDI
jgi:transcriptional regulator with XRE-family HTH domain